MAYDRAELITWAVAEIRDLDELCRGAIPGYLALQSDDILRLRALTELAKSFAPDDEEE